MVSYKCSIVTLSLWCTVFDIFDFENAETLKTGFGVHQGHWKCHHSIERIWLPILILHSNHEPISYRLRDRGPFQSKIATFFHPLVFCAPLKGSPWNWVPMLVIKTKTIIMGLPAEAERSRWRQCMSATQRDRCLTISSAVWIESATWRKDGQRATAKTALTHSVAQQKSVYTAKCR